MTRDELVQKIVEKKSYLCVGLDTDIQKIPKHLLSSEDPIFEFNKQIIDATAPYCVAYKPNMAFYEALGSKGWTSLEKTLAYIPKDIFTIADAKRGDIGNTSKLYAKAFFENMNFDSLTVAPYMGEDSVKPFMEFDNKWVILLALTSNIGSNDFQHLKVLDEDNFFDVTTHDMYEFVIKKALTWGDKSNMMFVVGATQTESIEMIRALAPDHFLLVPGVGAQGGSLEDVSREGMNKECGLLVNSSRSIIYASSGNDFAQDAANEAKKIQKQMAVLLEKYM